MNTSSIRGRRIEAKVSDLEHRRPLDRRPPRQSAQPGEELRERERLREVVVGAGVQPRDAVLDRVAGGQHQDRGPGPGLAELAADLEAVPPGEEDVEDDRVVLGRLRHPDGVVAGGGDVRAVALVGEPAADQRGHLGLVLHDQHAHGTHGRKPNMRAG
jgi:hypothetical protein